MTNDLLKLSVLSLATYRGAKLVIDDEITREARTFVIDSLSKYPTLQSKVSYLLSCPWCISPYVAGVLLAVRAVSPRTYEVLSSILVASAVTGLVYENL